MKYQIEFYEDGKFLTQIGGPLDTIAEAISQLESLKEKLGAEETENYVGIKYERNGTPCAILVTGPFRQLITNAS